MFKICLYLLVVILIYEVTSLSLYSRGGWHKPPKHGWHKPPKGPGHHKPPKGPGWHKPPVGPAWPKPPVGPGGSKPPTGPGGLKPPIGPGGSKPPTGPGRDVPPVGPNGSNPPNNSKPPARPDNSKPTVGPIKPEPPVTGSPKPTEGPKPPIGTDKPKPTENPICTEPPPRPKPPLGPGRPKPTDKPDQLKPNEDPVCTEPGIRPKPPLGPGRPKPSKPTTDPNNPGPGPTIPTPGPKPTRPPRYTPGYGDDRPVWGTTPPTPNVTPRPQPTPGPKPTPGPGPKPTPKPNCRPKDSHHGIIFPDHDWPSPDDCEDESTTEKPYEPDKDILKPTEATTSSPVTKPPMPAKVADCIKRCPATPEYNPVCGTDFVQYRNPGSMHCAQRCGVGNDVRPMRSGRCPSTTSSTSTTTTTASPWNPKPDKVTHCVNRCPATSEFKPVCGTNYVQYRNLGSLQCAQRCGVDVKLMNSGRCPRTTTNSPETTVTTSMPPIDSTTLSPEVSKCVGRCPVTSEYNPICGTDYVLYPNPGRLVCAQMCGVDVRPMRSGRCPTTPSSTSTTPSTVYTTTASSVTPMPDKVKDCINRCPATTEFNPVCGTNFVQYRNPGSLKCAQRCGVDVKPMRSGRCPQTTTNSPVTTVTTPLTPVSTTMSPKVRDCIGRCPVTSEYNPVCGTDYVQYPNPGRLTCAQMCGVDVKTMRRGRCPDRPS